MKETRRKWITITESSVFRRLYANKKVHPLDLCHGREGKDTTTIFQDNFVGPQLLSYDRILNRGIGWLAVLLVRSQWREGRGVILKRRQRRQG